MPGADIACFHPVARVTVIALLGYPRFALPRSEVTGLHTVAEIAVVAGSMTLTACRPRIRRHAFDATVFNAGQSLAAGLVCEAGPVLFTGTQGRIHLRWRLGTTCAPNQ